MRAFSIKAAILCLIIVLFCPWAALGENLSIGDRLHIDIPSADSIVTNPGKSRILVNGTLYSVIDGGADLISTIQAFDRKTWSFYEMTILPETLEKVPPATEALLVGQIQFRQLENSGGTCAITVLDGDYQTGEYTVERKVYPSDIYQEFIYLRKDENGQYQGYHKLYLIQYAVNGRWHREYAVVAISQDHAPLPSSTPDPALADWIVDTAEATSSPAATSEPTPGPSPTFTASPAPAASVSLAPSPTQIPSHTSEPTATPSPSHLPFALQPADIAGRAGQWLPYALILLAAFALAAAIRGLLRAAKRRKARPVRFFKLSRIDSRMKRLKPAAYDEAIALDELCERFRNFAAARLNLYYDLKLIRLFVAGLSVSRLTIMQGISGTGKTSLAYACGKFFQNDAVIVPVQPSWRDRSDLLGYFNEFSKHFNETTLLEKLYEAGYTDDVYVTVLDEMNIARVEYYFAEFLSVLEMPSYDEWVISVVPDEWKTDPTRLRDGKIRLPRNMWYIGTANNDDSTFAISDKVYDRAMVIDIDTKATPFSPEKAGPVHLSAGHLLKLFDEARAAYALPKETRAKISELDHYLMERLRISFGNRIMRQMEAFVPVYLRCGGTEREALDYLLCKKVLRKLENQNLMLVRDEVDGLCAEINRLFGGGAAPECVAYLQRLKRMG